MSSRARRRPARRGTTSEQSVATLRQRFAAAAYDWLVLTVLGSIVMTAVAWISGHDLFEDRGALVVALVALYVLDAVYEVPATALTGQTIGKRLVGVRVTALDGTNPGWTRALRRWLLFLPFGLFQETAVAGSFVVGASIARDDLHRGIHDRFAGTVVVAVPQDPGISDPLKARKRR